jgi:hypothetical protein
MKTSNKRRTASTKKYRSKGVRCGRPVAGSTASYGNFYTITYTVARNYRPSAPLIRPAAAKLFNAAAEAF